MKVISVEKLINELGKYSFIQLDDHGVSLQDKDNFSANRVKEQDNIFLSTTMTGNLQLLRLEHIGYFRYNSRGRNWEAVLCDNHVLQLRRETNAETILGYHPHLIQINQSVIVNVRYLEMIKGNDCLLLSPFEKANGLQISKSFLKRLKERYPSI